MCFVGTVDVACTSSDPQLQEPLSLLVEHVGVATVHTTLEANKLAQLRRAVFVLSVMLRLVFEDPSVQ